MSYDEQIERKAKELNIEANIKALADTDAIAKDAMVLVGIFKGKSASYVSRVIWAAKSIMGMGRED